jgi:hypothetical protein
MMSEAEFTRFLSTTFEQLCAFSRPDSVHYICIDWRHLREFLGAGAKTYGDLLNLCVWVKSNGGMGSLYRSQHELIGVFKNGKAASQQCRARPPWPQPHQCLHLSGGSRLRAAA